MVSLKIKIVMKISDNCYVGISMIDINAYIHHNEVHNCHYGISSADGHANTLMEYNLMYDNSYGMRLYNAGNYLIDNCTFYGNSLGLRIYSYNSADVNSSIFYNNTTDAYASNGAVGMLEFFYCLIDPSSIDYDYADRVSRIWDFYDDPEFMNTAADDFRLKDTSPCIDRGDISREDPDNSRRDVGHHIVDQDEFMFSGIGSPSSPIWKWLSFPRLPVSTAQNTGQDVNTIYIREHWNYIPSETGWYSYANYPSYMISGEYESQNHSWEWVPGSDRFVNSTSGYKIWRIGSTCNLYSPGQKCKDDTDVSIVAGENWIGYFLVESQHPSDAFPSEVLNDLNFVKTQSWSWVRDSHGNWPQDIYTINYGDCVIVDTDADHTFEWETPRRSEPVYRPVPEHFIFQEEIDYQPIYLDFGENELPMEVAVFVDDNCRGAAVVDGQINQLNAYILECDPGLQVEFEFFYDNRMVSKRIQNYGIEFSEGTINNTHLQTGMPGKVYWVTFRDITFEIPEPPMSITCYPNPFNPDLTIAFSMDEIAEVEIVIYNSPADYNLVWNGKDDKGQPVSSGVYFVRLKTGNEVVNSKAVLIK